MRGLSIDTLGLQEILHPIGRGGIPSIPFLSRFFCVHSETGLASQMLSDMVSRGFLDVRRAREN
jgi:hypothetical protein